MITKRWIRRSLVAVLMGTGIALLALSPAVPLGLLPFAAGIALELLGLWMERH